MSQQVAIVTGAAGGIGFEISRHLSGLGYRVALLDRADVVHDRAEELDDALGAVADITDTRELHDAIGDIVARTGRADVLVNCAGTCTRVGFEELTDELWDLDIDTNLKATFFASQAVVFPYMRDQQYGRIVNIAASSAFHGGYGRSTLDGGHRSGASYAASKAGVVNVTRWIAQEVGRWNITCNAVSPGVTQTGMIGSATDTFTGLDLPIPRFASPSDIANGVAFLASEASSYVTGATLHVDGGLTLL